MRPGALEARDDLLSLDAEHLDGDAANVRLRVALPDRTAVREANECRVLHRRRKEALPRDVGQIGQDFELRVDACLSLGVQSPRRASPHGGLPLDRVEPLGQLE